jgi:hypothetical protein
LYVSKANGDVVNILSIFLSFGLKRIGIRIHYLANVRKTRNGFEKNYLNHITERTKERKKEKKKNNIQMLPSLYTLRQGLG